VSERRLIIFMKRVAWQSRWSHNAGHLQDRHIVRFCIFEYIMLLW
jgi:hypothetical protein